ncbi:hypothetical protein [Spelaeibacter cavernicola]|uniref:hypothetical protein n=1 Tax=Antrihabitans cavernicola TaxID=2495913 RepID=UPI001F31C2EA|nr:hypothetical protein [Spelaeibacter cavernicola]
MRSRNAVLRNVASATALAAALALAVPAVASALPVPGSSGGSSDTGSGLVDGGIDIIESGIGILGNSLSGGLGSSSPSTQQCDESTQSGHDGVTETLHQLGRGGPLSFVLSYETYNVPDQIEVFYQGALLYNTGFVGDDINEGTGSVVINVPAGAATAVLVRVTGGSSTDWDYTVHCPIS